MYHVLPIMSLYTTCTQISLKFSDFLINGKLNMNHYIYVLSYRQADSIYSWYLKPHDYGVNCNSVVAYSCSTPSVDEGLYSTSTKMRRRCPKSLSRRS